MKTTNTATTKGATLILSNGRRYTASGLTGRDFFPTAWAHVQRNIVGVTTPTPAGAMYVRRSQILEVV